ncbi:MAG: threonine--tRNA ligase, partial [Candidatus Berkelbacteria bacterium]|nr:threonine--tRNA ligase [Candidatus Berkelbacteria bacterium]
MKNEEYEDSQLYKIRHTASHILAMAAHEFDPEVKFAIGPPIENGFYYDFEFSKPLTEDDLGTLEKSMSKIIQANLAVKHEMLSHKEGLTRIEKEDQPYKVELVEGIEDEKLGFYTIDWFSDLCKGPHVSSTGEVKAFKLLSVAGAYWRGDEKKAMLTRVYGTAFGSKKELDAHLAQLEEAKKRDHKKLGPQLDLFLFSELVGAGLPLWTPKGNILRQTLDDYVWSLRVKKGYQKVEIPHIAKSDLYKKSGHWDKFQEDLMKIETREGHTFVLKPMNCPHHTQIFARKSWSYRELPQRYANTTMVYRDEQTGELAGLSRVRSITQDDAHVFCRPDQVKDELLAVWDIVSELYAKVGFKDLSVHLSFRDPNQPDKYLGEARVWQKAEAELEQLAKQKNANYVVSPGEAAFYGPKVDFMARDSLNRQWQLATIQLDMNLPERFDLNFINSEGKEEQVIMIHAAIMGSIERFLSVLIEHYAGDFPLWLAPVQAKILPISEKFIDYGQAVATELANLGVRFELDDASETLGKRIRNAENQKVP